MSLKNSQSGVFQVMTWARHCGKYPELNWQLTIGLLYLSRFDAASPPPPPPPRILTKRVLSLCFPPSLCYFPLLYLSWGDVASTSFLKELGPLRQRWRRPIFYRQEPAHTQTHNAHSFRFKHVNCFPSVLGTHPSLGNLLIVCEEFQLGLKGFLNWSRGSNT